MSTRRIQFTATKIEWSEAIDWEIIQVYFDTMDLCIEEDERSSPYLEVSANFEFGSTIQMQYHDGEDFAGDNLERLELWRNRVLAISRRGLEFDISFELSDDAFTELRRYLRALLGSDCFRE